MQTQELQSFVSAAIAKRIQIYPRNSIWVSQLHHPCVRQGEYALLRWQDAEKITPELQELFDEGKLHEQSTIDKLQEAGFTIQENQRPLSEQVIDKGEKLRYTISGRIDFTMRLPRETNDATFYPVEVKGLEPHSWAALNTIEDVRNSKRYYVRMYEGQINMYLYQMSVPRGYLIIKNKVNGRLKLISVDLNLSLVEHMLQNATRINRVVAEVQKTNDYEKLDARIEFDERICGGCAFRALCLPAQQWGKETIILEQDIADKIERRELLSAYASEYKELDEELKEHFKTRGDGKYLIGSHFDVTVKSNESTVYDVPDDVKQQYKTTSKRTTVKFNNVK